MDTEPVSPNLISRAAGTEKAGPDGDPAPSPQAPASTMELDLARVSLGREVVAVALLVVLGAFILTVVAFRDAAAVATAMGTVTTLIGTLIGTYFGIQVGSQGRAEDATSRDQATQAAVRAASFVEPAQADAFNQSLDSVYGVSPGDTYPGVR